VVELRKECIEQAIRKLMGDSEKIGLDISEFVVNDKKIIHELEKVTKASALLKSRKPAFVSPKNYRIMVGPGEYGYIYGIRLIDENKIKRNRIELRGVRGWLIKQLL